MTSSIGKRALEKNLGQWERERALNGPCGCQGCITVTGLVPARVLAEVAAKREILDLYEDAAYHAYHQGDDWQGGAEDHRLGLQRALEALAQPYADHPDYDQNNRLTGGK